MANIDSVHFSSSIGTIIDFQHQLLVRTDNLDSCKTIYDPNWVKATSHLDMNSHVVIRPSVSMIWSIPDVRTPGQGCWHLLKWWLFMTISWFLFVEWLFLIGLLQAVMLSGSTVWKDVGNYCDPYFDLSDIFNRGIPDMAEKVVRGKLSQC